MQFNLQFFIQIKFLQIINVETDLRVKFGIFHKNITF